MSLTRVRDLMTTDVFTLDAEQDFRAASDIFDLRHVRHLPVVQQGKLVGLVTQRDLMRAQAKLSLELMKPAAGEPGDERVVTVYVRDFMTKDKLVTCEPSTPADDAARLMLDHKLGCVLVTEGEKLIGILTEADLVSWSVEVMAKMRLESPGSQLNETGGG